MSPVFFSKYTEYNTPEFYTLWRISCIEENRELDNTGKLYYYNEGLIKKLRELEKAFQKKRIDPVEIARIIAFIRIYSEAKRDYCNSMLTDDAFLLSLDDEFPIHLRKEFISLEQDYGRIELPRWVEKTISRKGISYWLHKITEKLGLYFHHTK